MVTRPAEEAIQRLEKAVTRSKRRSSVRLPQAFARDSHAKDPHPPLARVLAGGGEIRLKVLVTVLMMATEPPHATKVASKDLAAMLGLRDPDGAGARRVNKAIRDLEGMSLVERKPRPGHVPGITVLNPEGAGGAYNDLKLSRPYITLPITLWKRGWLISLSGRALALLIILREVTGGRTDNTAWLPGIRKEQYGLSPDTWTRASRELEEAGLLTVTTEVLSFQGEPRRRNWYALHLDRLPHFDPGDPPPDWV